MTRPRRTKFDPAIERVPLDKVTIIDITEAELDALERGSPESLFLNLAIAALSIASSFLIGLLTTTIEDVKTFCVFVIISVLGFVSGVTFALLWWQFRRSLKKVAQEIRGRMRPESIAENAAQEETKST